jgi:hypothetical protein
MSGVSANRRGVGAGERPSHAHAFVRAQLSRSQPISADLSRSRVRQLRISRSCTRAARSCSRSTPVARQIAIRLQSDCNQIPIRFQSDSSQIAIHACGSSDSNQIAIRGHARQIHASFRLQSEAISGHQRPSEATKVHPWPSGAAYHLLLVAQSRLVQEGLAACEPRTQGRRERAHGPIAAEEQPFGREMGQAVEHLMREAIKRRSERRSERLRERYAEQCGTQ